jgi:hypothetical protein
VAAVIATPDSGLPFNFENEQMKYGMYSAA